MTEGNGGKKHTMAETRRRARSRKAHPEVEAQPEPAGDEVESTSAQVSDANTVEPPAAEIDVFEESQAPASENVEGVHADADVTYTSAGKNWEENGAGGPPVDESPGTVAGLFQRQEFMEELVAAMFTDGQAADNLVRRLSEKLQDRIEDDAEFKGKLLASAFAAPGFRDKVVKALVKAMR